MGTGVIVAIVAGLFSLSGTIITAIFALVAARKARNAERERDREKREKEAAVGLVEGYRNALTDERAESARLREELRRRPRDPR